MSPDGLCPGDLDQQHHADPAYTTGFHKMAISRSHRIPVNAHCLVLAPRRLDMVSSMPIITTQLGKDNSSSNCSIIAISAKIGLHCSVKLTKTILNQQRHALIFPGISSGLDKQNQCLHPQIFDKGSDRSTAEYPYKFESPRYPYSIEPRM